MNGFFSNLYLLPDPEVDAGGSGQWPSKSLIKRILRAGYVCDIIRDGYTEPAIHHWVVQNCDTDEIVGLGQAHSLAEAEVHAVAFLDDLRLRRAV